MKKYIYIFVLLALSHTAIAQQPNKVLNLVYTKLKKAQDYTVDAHIKVDLPFIKMLPINAKIYFKQKDKFKIESKSIAIIPKQSFVQLTQLIADTNKYTAVYQGAEKYNNTAVSLISIIPSADIEDIILGKLWVDEKQQVILKSQITTKSNGTIITEYIYGQQLVYGLPDVMNFEIDIKKFKIPKSIAADINSSKKAPANETSKKGKIKITLTNYQVNKGISDAFFKK